MQPINLMAPINNLGYGVVGYNILRSLVLSNNIVCYFPIGDIEWEGDEQTKQIITGTMRNARTFAHHAPSVKIFHQNEMALFPGRGLRVGWPIFELNRFTDLEKHHLSSLDRIIVCSQWAKDVIASNGIHVPTKVVPLGVDNKVFFKNAEDRAMRPYWSRNKTVFMNVGKWEVRKGHNELLEAFNKAFEEKDDVELWMMNDNPFIGIENEMWKQKYIESKLGSKIKMIGRLPNQAMLRQLFNQIDYGVFPSHAEGWNLEPLEMMACGAEIIATNYSGHTEYLNESNSLLVNPTGMEIAQDGKWFHGQGEWCKFDIDTLVEQLREAHKKKQDQAIRINNATVETVAKFTWENSAKKLLEAVQ
jgi:glycosyltransferase involved in cell wall biosynthesis